MRRFLSLIAVMVMCLTLAVPVFANSFVPSISYKDGAEIVAAEQDGEDVTDCLVVTSLKEAKEKTTDIYQEDRDLLWDLYEKIKDSDMELPLENKSFVVRELVDVSYKKENCVESSHGHKEWLAKDDTTLEVVFDLGVEKGLEVEAFVYLDGQWVAVKSVKNNGDGTVTVVFDDICPVAFCVKPQSDDVPPKTGDPMGENMTLWLILLIVSFAAIVVLVLNRRRIFRS